MVQVLYNIFGYFDVPMHLVLCERKKGQGKHNRFLNNAIFVHWKHVRDMELRWVYGRSPICRWNI